MHLLCLQLGHLHGLAHQPVQPVGLLIHDGQQLAPVVGAHVLAGQQRTRRTLDTGQGRAQLMRDRIENQRPQPLAFLAGLAPSHVLQRLRTV